MNKIDFNKLNGLVPAIIQDASTKNVLMLGFMNQEAYEKTLATKHVTFWSRTRNCLWTKGETSGNFLNLVSIQNDCDNDTLLIIQVPTPAGVRTTLGIRSPSFPSCRTSSRSATRRCLRVPTPPSCSRTV